MVCFREAKVNRQTGEIETFGCTPPPFYTVKKAISESDLDRRAQIPTWLGSQLYHCANASFCLTVVNVGIKKAFFYGELFSL
jgi:hypothetical protein